MRLLSGFQAVQIGPGAAAAVCGRILADVGAQVTCIGANSGTPLLAFLNHAKPAAQDPQAALASAQLIVREGAHPDLTAGPYSRQALRRINPAAALVTLSPYGETGPRTAEPASDLTLFYASGLARLLTGQVDDLAEAPLRAVGEQSAFIGGLAAACAGMHAALGHQPGALIDVSLHEALATMAMTELTRAGLSAKSWERKRVADGNGATVTILPASDGYTAISPREEKQWSSWLTAMGSPDWGADARFVPKANRVKNWDALHALMSQWSRQHDKQWIADTAQAAHVPSFPLREVSEHLDTPQMRHRRYYRALHLNGKTVQAPGAPFGLHISAAAGAKPRAGAGALPLSGIRVLDFSWVIAGPTATRYLAAMGAEVIKVEAPGKGDPGRGSALHTVLGQAKKAIVLDLKKPEAVELARALAAQCDLLIENFATGVMDRLGLGADALKALNPGLIYISASGMGRSGPGAHAVAYGTLLQCYAGFAGLNRHPGKAPRVGFAWLDPMCALMLAFIAAAALWQRQREGGVARVDFSMIEAMLWTMAEPLLAAQCDAPPQPMGNASAHDAPHGAWRCAGEDDWLSLAVCNQAQWRALCGIVPGLSTMAVFDLDQRRGAARAIDAALAAWAAPQAAANAARSLVDAGIPAAALARSADLVSSAHLAARNFWEQHGTGVLPGLPWRASFGRVSGPAPALGEHTDAVLRNVLGLSPARIAALRASGVIG
ncbi:MAG: CoA transferase [Betaproteobacteria bacterium]|nr:CoA transferase [Betaproteobacteria bacterium]